MNLKEIKIVSLTNFFHLGGPTYKVVQQFTQLISIGLIDIKKLKLITINYNIQKNDVESGPVKLFFSDGLVVYLNLTAGYNGSGPNDLCKILEICNITFDRRDITNHQDDVNLKYIIDRQVCYQFKKPDGNYEYSM